MKEYTDNELLELLYNTWMKKGTIKCEDFRPANGMPHYQIFSKRFGSWENAKELAGVKQNNRKRKSLNKDQIIAEFQRVCSVLNEVPTQSRFVETSGLVGEDRVRTLFGEYDNLIIMSGFDANKYKSAYKKEFLISEIKRFVDEFGEIPNPTSFEKLPSYPSRKTFSNHFGSFEEALKLVGYEAAYVNDWYKKDKNERKSYVKNSVLELYKLNGCIPTMEELIKYTDGAISRTTIRKDFESYNNVLDECGIINKSIMVNGRYTDEYLKNEFDRFVSENGRIPQIHEFNKGDYPSFWCYQSRFGSWNKAVLHYGYEPTYTIRRYTLPNGEECDSLYELNISTWLQENNVEYTRNIPYNEICKRYKGKMNCDYKIIIDDKEVYVEMAGFLPRTKVEWDKFSTEEKNYARKMRYKKKIMDRENVKYYIIYPDEINNLDMRSIFEKIKSVIKQ